MRHIGRKIIVIFIVTILLALGFLALQGPVPTPINVAKTQQEAIESSVLQVHFIDVGQGDCTLICYNGTNLLIDAGNNDKGTAVQRYLQKQGITKLDYVIATHPDADHIGGMDVILTKFDCGKIFMPDVENDTESYRDMMAAMEYKRYQAIVPKIGEYYALGEEKGEQTEHISAYFTIIAPNAEYEDNNNSSIGIRLTHGKNSFVFTGDAKEVAEKDIVASGLELSAEVLKIAHHGSSGSTTHMFLEAINPTYAVISCGTDNDYGHPALGTLNRLKEAGIQVFRTDEQGTVVATSDGNAITFNCEPSESWKPGIALKDDEKEETISLEEIAKTYPYVINTRTGKFHKSDCESVADMYRKNRQPTDLSREEILEMGYVPCKSCCP